MKYTIGLAQCDAVLGDVEGNLRSHRRWIARARERGVDLLIFPELSLTGYLLQDLVHEVSLRADDPRLLQLSAEAAPMGLCVGGIEESPLLAQHIAGFVLDGDLVKHVHRKTYLASYGVFDEARYVGAGGRIAAFDSRWGRLGLAICEDCWHPSLVNLLFLDGAWLLIAQTASPVRDLGGGDMPRNAQTWIDTLRAYARLYGAYVAFCNRVGSEDGLVFWGRSTLFGPTGEEVASGPLYAEELVVGTVDLAQVREARLANPVLRDERVALTIQESQRLLGQLAEPVAPAPERSSGKTTVAKSKPAARTPTHRAAAAKRGGVAAKRQRR